MTLSLRSPAINPRSPKEERPLRIAMVASSYPRFPGDIAGVFVRSLAEQIAAQGHQVQVLAPYHPAVISQNGSQVTLSHFRYTWAKRSHILGYAQALENDQHLRRSAHLLIPFYLLSGLLSLLALTKGSRFDLVHAHWVIPNGPIGALAATIRGLPLVVTIHGSDLFVAEKLRWAGKVAGATLERAALITACSPDLGDRALRLGASPERLHIIPWGVDQTLFRPSTGSGRGQGDGAAWRQRLDIGPDQRVVLAAGRLVEKKGLAYLVEAAPQVLARRDDVVFVLAGDGPLLGQLRQRAVELGLERRILFPGLIPWHQMPDFLALGDIFVAPSVRDDSGNIDGLPTVILEAMACGKAIVASRTAGIPLVVAHGQNGLLVPERSPEALAGAIGCLLERPQERQRLGAESRRRVEQEFTWRAVAEQFIALYHQTVEGPP